VSRPAGVPAPTGRGPGREAGDAPEPEEAPTSFLRLASYLRPYRGLFVVSLLLMVASAVFDAFSLTLLIPFLRSLFQQGEVLPDAGQNMAERVLDWAVGGWVEGVGELEALRIICLVVLAALFFKNFFLYGARVVGVAVQERIERDMRDEVYARLQRLPLDFFAGEKAGQLLTRVLTDTRQTKRIVSFALAEALRHGVTAVAYLAVMVAISWRLTLLSVVLVPILLAILRPILRRLRKGFRQVYDRQGELMSILQETVSGIRLVKAYGGEEREQRRFEDSSDEFARGMIRTEALSELASPLSEVLSAVVALVLLWLGATMVLGSGATLGPEEFVTFIALALSLVSPVKALAEFPARAQSALAAADRFFEVVDAEPEPTGPEGARELEGLEESVAFHDVTFAYEDDRPVLRDVDLRVGKGDVVALVGPSGAGKSTLVDLLPRFIDPDGGRVEIDGTDVRAYTLASLRRQMGVVSQETVIFHDTVRANIAYGDRDGWTDEQVWRAARAANAADFIRELPEGMETRLGDRGIRLSGGQRQRIGIARAVLRDPPILILDEATSDLDTESERLIQRALRKLLAGRTVFVIAHRLSTVRDADRIVVLDRGRIVERGTHEELHAAGDLYRKLYEMQFRGEAAGGDRDEAEAGAGAGSGSGGNSGSGAGSGSGADPGDARTG
jgi:subfamily B ATP-binding cassette protein MsbA